MPAPCAWNIANSARVGVANGQLATLSRGARIVCAWRPMSARELAALLGDRDHKVLVRQHLTPISETGELTLTIPEMPHHPDQKYTVPGKTVQ